MRLAFVTPRYGADISVGPEHACRLLAEHISRRHDVDVITTCARDAEHWRNDLQEGPDRIRGVRVRRFPVSQVPPSAPLEQLTARLLADARSRADELEWVRQVGPWSPALLEHLKQQCSVYDAVVFFSGAAATTVFGLPLAPGRAVLFPYLQLGPALRLGLWNEVFAGASAVGLLSAAERPLLHKFVGAEVEHEELVGIGIELSPEQSYPRHQQDPADVVVDEEAPQGDGADETGPHRLELRGAPFRRRHRLHGPFALYGGRFEQDNGCQEMLDYFESYSAAAESPLPLVLMGAKLIRVGESPHVRHAGLLPDRERMIAYEAAEITIAPGSSDLTAESVLESFAVGTPVVVSARNAAAVEHCSKADAGLYYESREEFVECMRLLARDATLRQHLGENGRKYVDRHYRWDAVVSRLEHLVGHARGR